MSWDRRLIGRAGFYIRIEVNPQNPDEVLIANSSFHRSTDGGLTFPPGGGRCGDCHDIWIDPKNGDHWVVTDDGGIVFTTDHAKTFTNVPARRPDVPRRDRRPDAVLDLQQPPGQRHDARPEQLPGAGDQRAVVCSAPAAGRGGAAAAGPAAAAAAAGVPWQAGIGGCESGFTIPVPGNPDIIWATCYGNEVTRFDNRSGARAR